MDISSFAGASGGMLVVFAILKIGEYIRDVMIKREGKLVSNRAQGGKVDDETKVIKLNGTRCDSHQAIEAKLDAVIEVKEDVKEVSHKLDRYAEQIFDRLRLVERDVAVLQAKGQ